MHNFARVVIVAVLTFGLISCGTRENDAYMRVVNASPDSDELTVRVDTREIEDNLRFRQYSQYRRVADGTHRVGVWQGFSSGIDPYRSFDFRFSERTFYTLVALDWEGKMQTLMLADDNVAPAAGNARVRFVQAGAFTFGGAVDVYITAPGAALAGEAPDFTVIPFAGITGYLELPAGQYQVRVTNQGLKVPIADSGPVAFSSTQVRTLLLVDNLGGAGLPYSVTMLADVN